ncbi:UNVERIFIED_CONTAM: hypothetical protein GTU68_046961 [Idotea baltica]|nr:hypothetical protein [Idotea baltica]
MNKASEDIILKVEDISKQYRLGLIGTGTISHDLNRWWSKVRGKEDPYLKVGSVNDRSTKADSDYVWALQEINFEVKRGEVLGIIGKNGAGKSTLLKILSRVTSPSTGEIKTKGRIASLLEVGTGFHPELTGKENIYLNGAILGMSKSEIKKKEQEIIDFSGCARYIDTPVKRYSSGMRVRLAFAVAAFLEPDIMVVDEVLAVGDAEFQKKAIGKMQDISKGEGRTVLFVSHNMDSVRKLCTRGILLEHGKVSFEGEINKVVDHYLNNEKSEDSKNLEIVKERSGNGKLIATKIEIFNIETDKIITEIISGMDVKFRVYYKLLDESLLNKKLVIGLTVRGRSGTFVTVFNNEMIGSELNLNKKEGFFECLINKFPLTYGNFSMRIIIKVDNETADKIENALGFYVHDADFFDTGNNIANGRQGVYVQHKWM